jgi:ubiquinone/menaquinone biosynthesis C-methylase UbiE
MNSLNTFYRKSYRKLHREGLQGWGNALVDRLIERHTKRFLGMRILELGASSGEHLQFVSIEPAWHSYTCLDISPGISNPDLYKSLVRSNEPIYPRIKFVEASVENIPFHDNSFDLVVTTCLLAHVREPEKALSEIRRVVKPGGQVVIALPADPGILNRLVKKLITFPKMKRMGILSPNLEYAREHINGVGNLLEFIKSQFSNDDLKLRYFPFGIKSWNFSLAIVAN